MHHRFAEDGFSVFSRQVLPLLERFCPADIAAPDMRSLLENPQATFRTSHPAHVTTSSVLLSADNQKVLLLFHRKIGEWVYPGGHADGDWHLLRSALRECFEETSLKELEVCPPRRILDGDNALFCPHLFQRFSIRETPTEAAHVHFDAVFVFRNVSNGQAVCDPLESSGSKWVTVEDLRAHATRADGVVDGLSALTAQICLRGMQSALGTD
jgi:8-oxo-dGTP pyrophosphatase MutT (NUDIX family)